MKERNIKIQFLITSVLVLIAILSDISNIHLAIVLFICFTGITLELINTGVEKFIDLIHPEYNKEVGKFKDEMAAIVVLVFGMAVIISLIILYPSIISILSLVYKDNKFILMILMNIILILTLISVICIKNKN